MVGEISNKDEINEILNVVKVFLVEERMRYLAYNTAAKKIFNDTKLKSLRKINNYSNLSSKGSTNFTVRGFN